MGAHTPDTPEVLPERDVALEVFSRERRGANSAGRMHGHFTTLYAEEADDGRQKQGPAFIRISVFCHSEEGGGRTDRYKEKIYPFVASVCHSHIRT